MIFLLLLLLCVVSLRMSFVDRTREDALQTSHPIWTNTKQRTRLKCYFFLSRRSLPLLSDRCLKSNLVHCCLNERMQRRNSISRHLDRASWANPVASEIAFTPGCTSDKRTCRSISVYIRAERELRRRGKNLPSWEEIPISDDESAR